MKFYKYLNEQTYIKEAIEINDLIYSNCRPYLRLIDQLDGKLIKRGLDVTESFGEKRVRKDRRPLGMSYDIFKLFNEWLEKNGHNRRDQSVSVSSNTNELFGKEYYFFPIGDFSYSWLESQDVNMDDRRTGWYMDAVAEFFDDPYNFDRDIHYRLDKPFADYFHTDRGISRAYDKGFEMWFNCDMYYYVDPVYYEWDNKEKIFIDKVDHYET